MSDLFEEFLVVNQLNEFRANELLNFEGSLSYGRRDPGASIEDGAYILEVLAGARISSAAVLVGD